MSKYSDVTIYGISRIFRRLRLLTQPQYTYIVMYSVSGTVRMTFDEYIGAQKGLTDLYVYTANGREKI